MTDLAVAANTNGEPAGPVASAARFPTFARWWRGYRVRGLDPLCEWLGGWSGERDGLALSLKVEPEDENAWLKQQALVGGRQREASRRKRARNAWWLSLAGWLLAPFATMGFAALALVIPYQALGHSFGLALYLVLGCTGLFALPAAISLFESFRAGWRLRLAFERRHTTRDLICVSTPPGDAASALHWTVAEQVRRWSGFAGRYLLLLLAALWLSTGIELAASPKISFAELAEQLGWLCVVVAVAAWLAPTWLAGCYERATATALAPDGRGSGRRGLLGVFVGATLYLARWTFYLAAAGAVIRAATGDEWMLYLGATVTTAFSLSLIGERFVFHHRLSETRRAWLANGPLLDRWLAARIGESDRSE